MIISETGMDRKKTNFYIIDGMPTNKVYTNRTAPKASAVFKVG